MICTNQEYETLPAASFLLVEQKDAERREFMSIQLQNLRCLRASTEQSQKKLLKSLPGQGVGVYLALFLIYEIKNKKKRVLMDNRRFSTNLTQHGLLPGSKPLKCDVSATRKSDFPVFWGHPQYLIIGRNDSSDS